MAEEDIGVEDLAANQGRQKDNSKKWRPGRAEFIIVLIYTIAGPPIGVIWMSLIMLFMEPEKFLPVLSQLPFMIIFSIPFSYFAAIFPAAITGFFVAVFCTNVKYCFAASILSPIIIYATLTYFDLSFLGMVGGAGKYNPNYINFGSILALLSSVTLFFLTASIRKQA